MLEEVYLSNAIVIISLLLIFLFLIVIAIYSVTTTTTSASYTCPASYCPTSLQTGAKDCSRSEYNPAEEVCNPQYFCTNIATPYALNSNGGTNNSGVCEANVECNCVPYQRCPNYIASVFVQDASTGMFTATQIPSYNNSNNDFSRDGQCTVPFSVLTYSTPGCSFIGDNSITDLTPVAQCMNMDTGCDSIPNAPPCARGTLAFITSDGTIDVNTTPIGCVNMEPCSCNQIATYNLSTGRQCVSQ